MLIENSSMPVSIPLTLSKVKKESTRFRLPPLFKLMQLKTEQLDSNGPLKRTRVVPSSSKLRTPTSPTKLHHFPNEEDSPESVEQEPGSSRHQERHPTISEEIHVKLLLFIRDHGSVHLTQRKIGELLLLRWFEIKT